MAGIRFAFGARPSGFGAVAPGAVGPPAAEAITAITGDKKSLRKLSGERRPKYWEETLKAGVQPTHDPELAMALFRQQWRMYRKVVENNYLFHREAYDRLHRILVDEVIEPFRFLDIACGDASATVNALKGTRVAHYHGIDLCRPALDLASKTLAVLDCPVTLDQCDFVEAIHDRPEPVDVAWIGLSLHHLLTPEKLSVMRKMRGIVGDHGLFLIYEDASPDGEDRDAWLRRWDRQKPGWT
ncbi:MAG TPA: class I SAM-dependent methyltransferase, partial [Chthoniobacterales bacterium]|nr:class I SAM-dependent methyltransferase [Chthoniobacterales bacterium]